MSMFNGVFVLRSPAYLYTVCDSFLCRWSIRRNFDNSIPRLPKSLGTGAKPEFNIKPCLFA